MCHNWKQCIDTKSGTFEKVVVAFAEFTRTLEKNSPSIYYFQCLVGHDISFITACWDPR